jgi:hypothetical protein
MTTKKLTAAQSVKRLKQALLDTKMANELFVDWIADGTVTSEYAAAAFANFRQAKEDLSVINAFETLIPYQSKDRYVVGFVFSKDLSRVLLVLKNRPAWQDGKFNGIGGKIEGDETAFEAMNREFVEETYFDGWMDTRGYWRRIVWEKVGLRQRPAMNCDGEEGSYEVHIFAAMVDDVRELVYREEDDGFYLPLSLTSDRPRSNSSETPVWTVPKNENRDPRREQIFALPLNREILARRGVAGLAGLVDLAIQSYKDGSFITVTESAE